MSSESRAGWAVNVPNVQVGETPVHKIPQWEPSAITVATNS